MMKSIKWTLDMFKDVPHEIWLLVFKSIKQSIGMLGRENLYFLKLKINKSARNFHFKFHILIF